MKIKKTNILIYSFYIFMYYQLLMISFHLPMLADDFVYCFSKADGTKVLSLIDIFKSCYFEYFDSNGRFIVNFLNQLLLLNDNLLVYRLIYPLPFIGILFCVFYFIRGRFPTKKSDIPSISIIIILILISRWEVLNQTFFWFTGYSNYILPMFFIFLALLPISDILLNRTSQKLLKDKYKYLFLFIGFIAGFSMEHYGLILLCFILCAIIYNKSRHNKIDKCLYFLFIGTIIGFSLLIFSPGLWNKNIQTTTEFNTIELIHFGYTRFLYTYFALNQQYFLILGIISSLIYFKLDCNKLIKVFLLSISFISILIPFELLINTPILIPQNYHNLLLGAWSFYIDTRHELVYETLIYGMEFLNIFVLTSIFIKKRKSYFPLLITVSSICAQMIFIISTKGVERAALISSVLIIILILLLITELNIKNNTYLNYLVAISSIVILAFIGITYINQYKIFMKNTDTITYAKSNNTNEIYLTNYDYKYVFISELDDSNQQNWILKSIRNYYDLSSDVIIKFK